jgi:hypothetical protein
MNSNSFSVNTTGGAQLFPLGFALRAPAPGIWTAYLHAQSLIEVAEDIVRTAQPNLCVFEVGHMVLDAQGARLLSLAEIARAAGIAPTELDVGALLIRTAELPALLSELPHYDMSLLDLPDAVSASSAYAAVIDAAVDSAQSDRIVLEHANSSTVFLSNHDDCYLYVETRSRVRALEYFARLLQQFVVARLGFPTSSVGSPTHALLEDVLSVSCACTLFDVHSRRENGRLLLGYSTNEYRLGDLAPEPQARLIYDEATKAWSAG